MAFNTMLVPTDFSLNAQMAFQKAVELAEQLGAKLYVLHVQDEGTIRMAVREGILRTDSTEETLQSEVEQLISERLATVIAGVDKVGVTVESAFRRGDPKTVIIDFANEITADLIVVGMSGLSATEKLRSVVFGSVAESVMRKSPCPTIVVRVEH